MKYSIAMKDPVNIQIDRKTREHLKDIGSKRETYDAVIIRLLDFYYAHRDEVTKWRGPE